MQIFDHYSKKSANFENFLPTSANLENFSQKMKIWTTESEK